MRGRLTISLEMTLPFGGWSECSGEESWIGFGGGRPQDESCDRIYGPDRTEETGIAFVRRVSRSEKAAPNWIKSNRLVF